MDTLDANAQQGVMVDDTIESATEQAVNNDTVTTEQAAEVTTETPKETPAEAPKQEPVAPAEKPKKKGEGWELREIAEQRARRRALEREVAILKAAIPEGDNTENKPVVSEQEKAQAIAAYVFNRKCDDVAEAGRKEYQDFDDAVRILDAAGVMDPQFLDIITEMPKSHQLIYQLSENPEEARRIRNLPITKQALELARLEAKLGQPVVQKQVSKVTQPIKPVTGNGAASAYAGDDPQQMTDEQYSEWRKKWALKQR